MRVAASGEIEVDDARRRRHPECHDDEDQGTVRHTGCQDGNDNHTCRDVREQGNGYQPNPHGLPSGRTEVNECDSHQGSHSSDADEAAGNARGPSGGLYQVRVRSQPVDREVAADEPGVAPAYQPRSGRAL